LKLKIIYEQLYNIFMLYPVCSPTPGVWKKAFNILWHSFGTLSNNGYYYPAFIKNIKFKA